MGGEIDLLVTALEQAFRRKSWHGTNLLGSIRGIDETAAAWRPAPGRHNVWELIVHAAYWKYSVYRRFDAIEKQSFPYKGSNWFERPAAGALLKADVALLKKIHERLIAAVSEFPSSGLGDIPAGSKTTYRDLAIGAAAHDLYHAGQIQLLKRLRPVR